MKRVICLYRVSTVGQVDHDDIPMQKIACREYAATHQDWEIIDEISECVHHRNCAAKPAKLSMDSAEIEQRFRVN